MGLQTDISKIVNKRVAKNFKKLQTPDELTRIGEYAAELIKVRTGGLGRGVDKDGGNEKKLKELSPNYIKFRKKNKIQSPSKSRLTLSGQMLDDISVVAVSFGRLVLGFLTDRSEKIAGYHETGNNILPRRRFFHISKNERKKIVQRIRIRLRQLNRGS